MILSCQQKLMKLPLNLLKVINTGRHETGGKGVIILPSPHIGDRSMNMLDLTHSRYEFVLI